MVQVVKRLAEVDCATIVHNEKSMIVSRKSKNNAYITSTGQCCELLPESDVSNEICGGTVVCRVYGKTRPLFEQPCDSRLIMTLLTDSRDATIEAVSLTELKTHAIMIKVGNAFDICFMAVLHEIE